MDAESQRRLCSLIEQIHSKYNEINDIVQGNRSHSQQLADQDGIRLSWRYEAEIKNWLFGVYCARSL
jgi:hypothetical protein